MKKVATQLLGLWKNRKHVKVLYFVSDATVMPASLRPIVLCELVVADVIELNQLLALHLSYTTLVCIHCVQFF